MDLDIGKIFKDFIWKGLVELALKRLFIAVPFLGWGPIGIVVSWLGQKIANELYDGVHEFLDLTVIAFRVPEAGVKYAKTVVELKRIALTGGIESPDYKKAYEISKNNFAEFWRTAG